MSFREKGAKKKIGEELALPLLATLLAQTSREQATASEMGPIGNRNVPLAFKLTDTNPNEALVNMLAKHTEYMMRHILSARNPRISERFPQLADRAEQFLFSCENPEIPVAKNLYGGWWVRMPGTEKFVSMNEEEFQAFEEKLASNGDRLFKLLVDQYRVCLLRYQAGKLHGTRAGQPAIFTVTDFSTRQEFWNQGELVNCLNAPSSTFSF